MKSGPFPAHIYHLYELHFSAVQIGNSMVHFVMLVKILILDILHFINFQSLLTGHKNSKGKPIGSMLTPFLAVS